ncbi:MAG: ABC transporter ATP-binding protein [Acidobacteriota bacterium]
MNFIRFQEVNKRYGGETVLEDFSIQVRKGETKVILGGSGSGKSTILKMVLGLVKPDSGRIFVADRDITDLTEDELMPIRKEIGMVFQEGALFDSLNVAENVAYRLREDGGQPDDEIEAVVRQVLGFVELEEAINKMPSELSGGMRRRVAIARALVGEPRILLYDEPTAGLDPITSRTICELMIKLRDLQGVTSIFVTHDLKAALTMASEIALSGPTEDQVIFQEESGSFCIVNTRFVILKDGKILFEGTDESMRQAKDEYIQELLS